MSKHLRVLRERGLVAETHPEFDARVRIYTLRSAPMAELRAWLDTAERGWAEQLAAFAAHLEREPDDRAARACSWRSACAATPARPFAAFTEEIGQWWRPNGLFQFTDGRDGTLAFEPGADGRLVETYRRRRRRS